ncbi:MAG: MFS transporter [Victivallales bacterium]|nr:MFS transporter [Victivallales bacterium]
MNDQKVWRNGTLIYTSSGLIMLFFLLLMGDFAWSLKDRSVGQILQLLIKESGASDTINALLTMSLPAALGVILTPIACYRSDRCRSRWGRRIPYLIYLTPVASVAIVGMAYSSDIGDYIAQHTSYSATNATLLMLGIFWALFEFSSVVAGALFTALVNDVVPHQMLGRFYGAFRCISLGAGIIFNAWFFGFASTHPKILFLGVCIIYTVGFLVMCFGVKEGTYPEEPEEARKGGFGAVGEYLRVSFSKPYYLLVFGFSTMTWLGMVSFANYGMFYAKSLDVSMDHFGKAIAITYGLSLVFSYPMGMLADRIHPLKVAIFLMFVYSLVAICGYFTVTTKMTFLIFYVLCIATAGVFFNGTAALLPRLLPQDNFATMSSGEGIIRSLAMMIYLPVLGWFLDWTNHHYVYLFLIASVGCFLAALIGLFLYRKFMAYGGPDNYQAP